MDNRLCPKCRQLALRRFDSITVNTLACRNCGEKLRIRHMHKVQMACILLVVVVLPSLLRLNPAFTQLGVGMRLVIQLGIGLPVMFAALLLAQRYFALELRRGGDN